jgi:hypothetical protein
MGMSNSVSQLLIVLTIGLIYVFVLVLPFWHIFRKAGFSPWLSLLMMVPLVNLVMLYFLAFATWPSQGKAAA